MLETWYIEHGIGGMLQYINANFAFVTSERLGIKYEYETCYK